MLPFLAEHHGDPARLHAEGRVTRVAVEDAREQVAELFGARPREVVFTASGTEAVNHAIWGAVRRAGLGGRVITTAVEHSSVLDACRREPGELTIEGVDELGRFDADELAAALTDDTALVSVQLANHEVGTLQPAAAVCAAAREREILVHVDACAAAGHVPIDFAGLGADLLSVSAHKLGGPKGVGALLIRRGLRIPPLIIGGAQERERRGGLENVPGIVGFGAAAAELAHDDRLATEAASSRRLTETVVRGVTESVAGTARYGDPDERVPHLVCLGIEGVEAEPILLALDQHGVAVHSGSSCSSEALEPSPVLEAMGADADRSLRVSVGWSSTEADVSALVDALPGIVRSLRALRTA
jgi:cysteine desulfurase